MREAALNRGIEINSRARQINLGDFHEFDLILTMDNTNLIEVNSLSNEAGDATKAIVKPLLSYSRSKKLLEVPDPYYGGPNGFENVLDLLEDACEGLLISLGFNN